MQYGDYILTLKNLNLKLNFSFLFFFYSPGKIYYQDKIKPYYTRSKMGKNLDINIEHRRYQVLLLLGQGLNLREISDKLDVSYDTILDDKKAITKSGIKFLKSIGNKEISFYYQGIIEDMNHIKN